MGTTAIVILIIYIVGVVINALVVASIWDDLTTDERLVKVRRGVLVFVVICSVLTCDIQERRSAMTRKEEINNASYAYWVDNYANIEFIDEEEKELHTQDIQDSFINGAEWADAHPDIDVRTMAAWRGGYKEAIDKACEYLEEYTPQKFEDVQNYVENFRKAMKGGEE